jgi:two-component system cell cycle sensor histidine kinase/response regulator CckA
MKNNPARILVVDDLPDQALALARLLEDLGHQVVTAHSGKQALEELDRGRYAVIIMDVVMPGIDGFQTAERLRLLPRGDLTPIILLTGTRAGQGRAAQAYSAGAVDYLHKPVDPELLRAKVQVFVALFRQNQELERHEERNRIFAELTTDYTAVLERQDGQLVVTEANDSAVRELGLDRATLEQISWHDLAAPESIPAIETAIAALSTGNDIRLEVHLQSRGRRQRIVEIFGRSILDQHSTVRRVYLAGRDRTEQRQLEAELTQAGTMDAIGRLAGGIAHDFNNMLTVIQGQCDCLMENISPETAQQSLEEIRDAAARSAELTKQLLAFSRKQVMRPIPFNVNIAVRGIVPLLERLVGETVRIDLRLADLLPSVEADGTQLERVILNLVVNAKDAMPDGGIITIGTREGTAATTPSLPRNVLPEGPYVILWVTDNGSGMDETTRQHLFEPFFTSKSLGRGTGLGLSTVYGIVRQCGGEIFVESTVGSGSTFSIYLPVRQSVVETVVPPSVSTAAILRGSETILLVEDEDAVRRLAAKVLSSAGYTVVQAHNGTSALVAARFPQTPIDMVITDVVMPDMNGAQVFAAVRQVHPAACVLYISGYPRPPLAGIDGENKEAPFLAKPFTAERLSQKVREILDPQHAASPKRA